MIGTSCRFCEFRVNDENGKQVGCEVGLLERYIHKYEATEIQVEDQTVDDDRGHDEFKLLPSLCLFRRPPGWKEAKTTLVAGGKTFAEIAREELTLKVTAVIFLDVEQTMQDLLDTIASLNQMSQAPSRVVIVNWSRSVKPHQFIAIQNQIKLPWVMETVLEHPEHLPPEYYDSKDLRDRRAYDIGIKKVETPFFIALKAGTPIPTDFIKEFETDIIDKLEGVIMHESEDQATPNFYQTTVYRIVGGNKERPVGDKIRDIAKEQECTHLIKNQKLES